MYPTLRKVGWQAAFTLLAFCNVTESRSDTDDAPLWATTSGWNIHVDTSIDVPGCFLIAAFEKGTAIRIGISPSTDNAYLLIGNDRWESLEVGKKYDLKITFEGETPWNATTTGVDMGGATMLMVTFDDPRFLVEFASRNALHIHYRDRQVAALTLKGSSAATQELLKCQEAVNEIVDDNNADPFKTTLRDDPFQ